MRHTGQVTLNRLAFFVVILIAQGNSPDRNRVVSNTLQVDADMENGEEHTQVLGYRLLQGNNLVSIFFDFSRCRVDSQVITEDFVGQLGVTFDIGFCGLVD